MSYDFSNCFPPHAARVHEVFGAGALGFAAIVGGQSGGSVLWIAGRWRHEQINPAGLAPYCDPSAVVLVQGADQTECLASAETALRSGAVSVVVVELEKPLSLIAGRRLNLAAQAGETTCILVIPEGMGSNAAETRWRCVPVFDPQDSTLQHWALIKNKAGTLGVWMIRWDAETRRVIMVSKAGE